MTFSPQLPTQQTWPLRMIAPWAIVLLVVLLSVVGRFTTPELEDPAGMVTAGDETVTAAELTPDDINVWLAILSLGMMGVLGLSIAAAVYALVTKAHWRARFTPPQSLTTAESGIWGFGGYFLCFFAISLVLSLVLVAQDAENGGSTLKVPQVTVHEESGQRVFAGSRVSAPVPDDQRIYDKLTADDPTEGQSINGNQQHKDIAYNDGVVEGETSDEIYEEIHEERTASSLDTDLLEPSSSQRQSDSPGLPSSTIPPSDADQLADREPALEPQSEPQVDAGWNWLIALATIVPLLWLGMRHGRQHFSAVIGLPKPNQWFKESFAGLRIYFACIPLLFVVMYVSMQLISDHSGHPIQDMIPAKDDVVGWLVLASIATIMAPIAEELTFRGLLYYHCRGWMAFVPASLLNGAIFAIVHPQGLAAMPVLAAMGFILAMIREARGNVIAPIAAHAAHNGMIMAMLFFAYQGDAPGLYS